MYILRRETQHTKGWEVRIVRSKGTVRELFSDSRYGGKNRGLQEARKFRDIVLKRIPKLNRKEVSELPKKTTIEDGVGISLIKQRSIKGGKTITTLYYQAFWSPRKGVYKARKFSVKKYGKEKAFQLAVAARKKGLKKMSI